MPDAIDGPMLAKKRARPEPLLDLSAGDSRLQQLCSRDHTVGTRRQLPDYLLRRGTPCSHCLHEVPRRAKSPRGLTRVSCGWILGALGQVGRLVMDFSRLLPVVAVALTCLLWVTPASATFPGENGKLTFELSRIFTVNPNGSALTQIQPDFGGVVGTQPTFSPDGRQIAFDFTGAPAGQTGWGIWVMSSTGTNPHQITRQSQAVAGQDTYPFWSPDGQEIGFVRDRDILVMNADGSGIPRNLTSTFFNAAQDPEWSPDGDRIVFTDGGDIFVVAADGSSAPQLIQTPIANDRYPSWSPNGNFIAYATNTQVRRVNPDGSNNVVLAGGFREVWDVAWSPDGSRIAFVNDFGNPQVQEELYVMNANGSGVQRVGVDTSTNLDWGVAAQGPPPPVLGETATVREVSGRVRIGLPPTGARAAQKGVDFVPLAEARDIPIGSFLDTNNGTVKLSTARNRAGRVQSGRFSGGLFQVLQSRARRAKGLTELRLKGSAAGFRNCRSGGASASALSRRTVRRLRAKAKGRYRSRGKHSAATVRGTTWTMADRCDGTLTSVKRGKVAVRDFRRKRTIVVGAGKSYLARAQG
jgi:Tol biopolymer transport system component